MSRRLEREMSSLSTKDLFAYLAERLREKPSPEQEAQMNRVKDRLEESLGKKGEKT